MARNRQTNTAANIGAILTLTVLSVSVLIVMRRYGK